MRLRPGAAGPGCPIGAVNPSRRHPGFGYAAPVMTAWQPDFDVYFALLDDDAPASFLVDLAAAQHAPLASHTARIQVRVALQQPDENGLRTADELEPLGMVEDALVEWLEHNYDAIYVGHLISDGALYIVTYAPAERAAEPESILDGFDGGDYEIGWLVEDDPEWGMLLEFMYPDAYAMQAIQNRRLLAVRAEHGDDPTLVHAVDHAASFDSQTEAERAAEALREAGFTVDSVNPDEESNGWTVCFQRDERLDGDRPDAFCVEILELLEPFDGTYSGWGAMILREPLAN